MVKAGSFVLLRYRGFEIDHGTALTKINSVYICFNSPTASSKNDALTTGKIIDNIAFTFPKTALPFNIKYPLNISAGSVDNFLIRIQKLEVQYFRKKPADGGFAGSHGPH